MTPVFHVPYSSRLSDYATSMDVRMRLLVNTTDIGINNRQVRLKMYVQGNGIQAQSSEVVVGMNPIYINGGELLTLTNLELAPLFRLENLEGMSPSQYANALPEGLYTVCFELYDFLTNQKISQKSCAQLYLMLNDPPLLNTPSRNESIVVSDFPNILFTWTPRQINATNVSYQFELKEILDPTIDPQIGFLTSPLLYEEELRSTALLYDVSKPNLLPGKRYAWRVRAMSTSGLSLNNVFKNEGYSEIYHFTYASHCPAPTFILSEAVSARSVRVSWLGDKNHTKYHLQYKKAPPLGAGGLWFEVYTMNPQTTLSDLEAGVSYEFRVGGSCEPAVLGNTGTFTYSGINQFSMPAAGTSNTSFTCGLNPTIAIANQTPITNLIVSETFTAGDFPVKILELTGNNPYSGKGYIIVPYLADTKIAVAFNNITVNTNYQLIKGVVETTYNPEAPNISDVEDLSGGNNGQIVTQTVPFVITTITTNPNGDIIVGGANGEQITIPGGSNTVITGGNGQIYNVDSHGNATGPFVPAPGGATTVQNTDGVASNGQASQFTAQGVSVRFEPISSTKYAWDNVPTTAPSYIKEKYAKVGSDYLSYKAVVNGQRDVLKAKIVISDHKIVQDSIIFKTQHGVLIDKEKTADGYLLTLKGTKTYAEEEVQAVIKQGGKYKIINAFRLTHISEKPINVTLIPLNSSSSIPNTAISQMQDVYTKAGVTLNIKTVPVLTYDGGGDNKITTSESGVFDYYTDEEKSINAKVKALPDYDPKTYYLIYSNLPSDKGIEGFMALGGQFGYIFTPPSGVGGLKTASHELAHGVFALQHPFANAADKGKTPFLMDYGSGTELGHLDWAQINNPALKYYGFQGDSQGEFAGGYVLTPDLKVTSIPNTKTIFRDFDLSAIPVGTLPGFTVAKDNVTKSYKWSGTNYVNIIDATDDFKYQIISNPMKEIKMMLFYNLENKCNGRFIEIEHNNHIKSFNPTASELLNIVDLNKNSSKLIDCKGDANGNNSWFEYSPAIDCSVANIQNLIGEKVEAIKEGINSITNASQVNQLLKNNYNSCVFESLDLDTRLKILNILFKEGVDDRNWEFSEGILSLGDKFFVDDLILKTPVADRVNLLKNGFMSNPKWLETLWKEAEPAILNNDVDLDDITQLISEMGNWVLATYNQLEIPLTQETVIVDSTTGNYGTATYPKGLLPLFLGSSSDTFSFVSPDGFDYKINVVNNVQYKDGKIEFEQNRIGKSRNYNLNNTGQAVYETKYYDYRSKLHPFEPLVLQLGNNYNFLEFGSFYAANKEIVVPAILAALYLQKVENNLTQHNVRQIGNGIAITTAIAATPFTGGGSLVAWSANMAVVGGITAAVDVPTQELKQKLIAENQYGQYREIFENWDLFYNTVGITEGALGLTQLGLAIKNINRVEAWNKFSSKIKNIPDSSPISYLKSKWNVIRGVSGAGNSTSILKSNTFFSTYLDGLTNGIFTRKFTNILSIEEEAVLKFYTTNPGYKDFNRALRGEIPMTDFYNAQKSLMEQALSKMPNSIFNGSKNLLYRIENLTDVQISSIYIEGSIINTKAFTSATYSENAIIDAIRNRSYTVLIRIEGKNGKLIEELSTLPAEKEILFKTGSIFEVNKVGFSPNPDDYMTPIKTIWLKEL
ncbi:ADP-ribosyltransferase exoenzyme [Flavobacterium columnare]|nr:ADP-ribosyltransferase [Flavobacterium columnare]SPE77504.1 ADP-ribosyltransferase exoenzyme [Flavobacterium columnare]